MIETPVRVPATTRPTSARPRSSATRRWSSSTTRATCWSRAARARAHRRRHLRPVRELREADRQDPPDGFPPGDTVPDLQAARGASLITSETRGHPTTLDGAAAPPPSRWRSRRGAGRAARRPGDQAPRRRASSTGRATVEVVGDLLELDARPQPRGRVQHRRRLHPGHLGDRDRARPWWCSCYTLRVRSWLGGRARPAARRGRRATWPTGCSARPALPWPRRRLLRPAALAGLQRRRHLHRLRRGDRSSCSCSAASASTAPGSPRTHAGTRRERPDGEQRTLLVPEGLGGERVDVGLGADVRHLPQQGGRARREATGGGGRPAGGQVRPADARIGARRDLPTRGRPSRGAAEVVEGIGIIHDDDEIVVIDKPVGVAVHPSMGWTGPTVVGHLRGAGFQIATSGAPERRGIVQRLDVGTSGVMVIAKSERAYSRAQERLPPPRGRQDLPRAGAGASRSARGHDRRSDRPAHQVGLEVHGARGRQAQRHPLRDARGAPVRQPARGPPRDRAHPPDPGAHGGAASTPASAT